MVTIRPRGGIPGSSSKIPTLGGIPNRGAPAPLEFMTVTGLLLRIAIADPRRRHEARPPHNRNGANGGI